VGGTHTRRIRFNDPCTNNEPDWTSLEIEKCSRSSYTFHLVQIFDQRQSNILYFGLLSGLILMKHNKKPKTLNLSFHRVKIFGKTKQPNFFLSFYRVQIFGQTKQPNFFCFLSGSNFRPNTIKHLIFLYFSSGSNFRPYTI